MNRRAFLAGAGALAGARLRGQDNRPPNFIVILTDDQRFDTIRALGNTEIQTPNMDRLAGRGVAFTHAFTQGGLTGAICMPSRAQILTGRSVIRVHHGIVDRQNDPDVALRTFPELLRQQGYSTFATGKWHNGPKLLNRSFADGRAIFFGGMSDHLAMPVFDYDKTAKYPKEQAKTQGKFSSEVFTDAALGFLNARPKDKPYLLYVAYTAPHDPRMAPKQFASLYRAARMKVPNNFMPGHPFDNGELKVRDELLAPFPRTQAEIRKQTAAYYAMISEVDSQIGRVLDAVERSGEANTYIILAGDNGLALGRHGLMGKQNLYDHSLRVPLIVSGPEAPAGKRAATLCNLMDLCPTILDLAGIYYAWDNLDGRSLRPVFKDQNQQVRDSVVAVYRNFQRAIRTGQHKLIRYNVNGQKTTQLFDLEKDPDEIHNLAADPTQAARLTELDALLRRRLAEAGDPINLDADRWA